MAYDALRGAEGVDPARIGVCGASYGGFLAALLSGLRDPKRLLIRAPALYPDDWLDLPLGSRGERPDAPHSQALEAIAIRRRGARRAGHRLAEPAWEAAFVRWLLEWFTPL